MAHMSSQPTGNFDAIHCVRLGWCGLVHGNLAFFMGIKQALETCLQSLGGRKPGRAHLILECSNWPTHLVLETRTCTSGICFINGSSWAVVF